MKLGCEGEAAGASEDRRRPRAGGAEGGGEITLLPRPTAPVERDESSSRKSSSSANGSSTSRRAGIEGLSPGDALALTAGDRWALLVGASCGDNAGENCEGEARGEFGTMRGRYRFAEPVGRATSVSA